ncbi:MAG: ADP-ribosylglycohydrolase family protein [Clostridiales bacterium]|nr:ADP-ribosylglycohydrolase family protein [Clostridiales bacterium]
MKKRGKLDTIRGSLIGGAVGDALGYAIEFWQEDQIFHTYGSDGITEYALVDGKAQISDDTQMTLFTAAGILVGDTRMNMNGNGDKPRAYVAMAYQDWLKTQRSDIHGMNPYKRHTREGEISWLLDVPELYALRAPGNTCLSSLAQRGCGEYVDDFMKNPVNQSKGCGGIMRIAPLALRFRLDKTQSEMLDSLDMEAAQIAAITHGHSLGYMPAAVVNHIISRILSSTPEMTLKEIVLEARDTAARIFAGDPHLSELTGIIDRAIWLSENGGNDLANIHALGEGWVAEETLGIALYCSLKYQDDFSKAMIASVNHKGDSDSTGAVTGNILGALVGYEAIEEKWKNHLELSDVILEMADDLCQGCQMSESGSYPDPAWESKYVRGRRYPRMS